MKTLINKLLGQQPSSNTLDRFADRPSLLDYDHIKQRFAENAANYQQNSPFPHIVFDNFLSPALSQALVAQYPMDQDKPEWIVGNHRNPKGGEDYVQKEKRHMRDVMAMPSVYRELIWELSSKRFLDMLTELSGIRGLTSDPDLLGAGIHQISQGGLLKIHADFSTHQRLKLTRRLNFLLYLNAGWQEEWGGHLELWDTAMQGPPKRVLPVLNRCVIFSTNADSYHGHPHPIACPPGMYRKSIALYYYTNPYAPEDHKSGRATLWQELPEAYRQASPEGAA